MKFRCKMVDTASMRDFTNIINVISRISKMCVIRLTPDDLCFNVSEDNSPVIWAELVHRQFFTEYLVVGVSDVQNEIYLEFDATMLSRSLNSLKQTASSTKIKLTNKQQPCLTVQVELPSRVNEFWQCTHDVPVRVIPRKEWPAYKAPNIPVFDVSIELPSLKHVRNIVERMKNMSPLLIVAADGTGTLTLKIITDSASVATHFQGLRATLKAQNNERDRDDEEEEGEDDNRTIAASIDVRKFLNFLAWDVIHPETVKCNILKDRIIYLNIDLASNVNIHYFIPSVAQ